MISRTSVIGVLAAVSVAMFAAVASAATPLSTAERSTLLSMREEEKLAHDVYVALAAKWGSPVFTNIAAAETRHGQALERALTAYGITDPTDGYRAGAFPSAAFQTLYDRLVAQGSGSLAAALRVGVEIEKLDIADLGAAIRATDEAMLDRIYGSLRSGSTRHLAAFERVLAAPDGAGCVSGGSVYRRGR